MKFLAKYADELEKEGIADISVGSNFSAGVDVKGNVYVWGKTDVYKRQGYRHADRSRQPQLYLTHVRSRGRSCQGKGDRHGPDRERSQAGRQARSGEGKDGRWPYQQVL